MPPEHPQTESTADAVATLPNPPAQLTYAAVTLRFSKTGRGDPVRGLVPFYHYRIFVADHDIGHLNFRIGDTEHVRLCAGHIGYGIAEAFRGHKYAYQACRAIAPFVREISPQVIITADPDNYPSLRTIERLGAMLLDEIAVPEHDPHYEHGARFKRRYQWTP